MISKDTHALGTWTIAWLFLRATVVLLGLTRNCLRRLSAVTATIEFVVGKHAVVKAKILH